MVVAAQTLGTKSSAPKIESMHLLGAAIGAKVDCFGLTSAVEHGIYNYYSTNDNVLKRIYSVVSVGQKAAGLTGFSHRHEKIRNVNVSDRVLSHSAYHDKVELEGAR